MAGASNERQDRRADEPRNGCWGAVVITINDKQYTEEDLTPEQISEVNYMISLQNELEGLKRRYQDIEIALKARQQAFLEGFQKPESEGESES